MHSIHGHKVLNLILSSAPDQSLQQLRQLITETFGEEANFHTCSQKGMDVDALLTFFIARGKVKGSDNRLNVDANSICQHHS
jgi:probable metal-binding protein